MGYYDSKPRFGQTYPGISSQGSSYQSVQIPTTYTPPSNVEKHCFAKDASLGKRFYHFVAKLVLFPIAFVGDHGFILRLIILGIIQSLTIHLIPWNPVLFIVLLLFSPYVTRYVNKLKQIEETYEY